MTLQTGKVISIVAKFRFRLEPGRVHLLFVNTMLFFIYVPRFLGYYWLVYNALQWGFLITCIPTKIKGAMEQRGITKHSHAVYPRWGGHETCTYRPYGARGLWPLRLYLPHNRDFFYILLDSISPMYLCANANHVKSESIEYVHKWWNIYIYSTVI